MKKNFYITTTLPYVNADPHIGFAKEIVEADVLARYHREKGDEVFFNTGVDEHGLKIFRKAEELGIDPQTYCDQKAPEFDKLKAALNLSYDNFIRTTDAHHVKAAQEFWKRCEENGDIYKKNYSVKYCVGCELEKTESELVDGRCPLHPNVELELIEEENYFFRFSAYQEKLLALYEKNPEFVLPKKRFNEIKSFVERGLEDFSISRLKSKMPWGVPVPGDEEHVMYVWFDALVNYISALGWPEEPGNFEKFWPGVQVCGKDNLRQQSAMWQAMLLSAGVPNSKQVFVNGFITVDGQKMSKSIGNVISPLEMVEKFGAPATRYLLLSGASFGEDFDITWEKMVEKYNADLANGLGNLVSRVIKLSESIEQKYLFREYGQYLVDLDDNFVKSVLNPLKNDENISELQLNETAKNIPSTMGIEYRMDNMELGQYLDMVQLLIKNINKFMQDEKPWELKKTNDKKFELIMKRLLFRTLHIAESISPFMPDTAAKIKTALETKKVEPLFQRIK